MLPSVFLFNCYGKVGCTLWQIEVNKIAYRTVFQGFFDYVGGGLCTVEGENAVLNLNSVGIDLRLVESNKAFGYNSLTRVVYGVGEGYAVRLYLEASDKSIEALYIVAARDIGGKAVAVKADIFTSSVLAVHLIATCDDGDAVASRAGLEVLVSFIREILLCIFTGTEVEEYLVTILRKDEATEVVVVVGFGIVACLCRKAKSRSTPYEPFGFLGIEGEARSAVLRIVVVILVAPEDRVECGEKSRTAVSCVFILGFIKNNIIGVDGF